MSKKGNDEYGRKRWVKMKRWVRKGRMSMEGKDESNCKAKIYFYLHLLTKTCLLDINFSEREFQARKSMPGL